MKQALTYYKGVAAPWICLGVYLWALEVRAAIGSDSEPPLAWLADCAAILLNLVFWSLLLSLPLSLIGTVFGSGRVVAFNKMVVKTFLILVTAMHLVRWLLNWQNVAPVVNLPLILLIVSAAGMGVVVLKRRKNDRQRKPAELPSMEECFAFAALPVVFGAAVLISISVSRSSVSMPPSASAGAVPALPENRPNIILVVADALRARSMSLYGHVRATTPNLDRWAHSATVFLRNYANSTSTKPSMTTLLTGKHPLTHGRLTKAQPPHRSGQNLLQILRDHGYEVVAVTSNEDASLNLLGFAASLSAREYAAFEHLTLSWLRQLGVYPTATGGRVYRSLADFLPFLGYPRKTAYYGFADETLDAARNFIIHARKPFFLLVHLHEPHDPYEASPPFRGMYSTPAPAGTKRRLSSGHYGRYDDASQSDADFYRDQYEESVRSLDEALGRFLGETEELLKPQRYFVVITSDHGESFERGFMNHGEDLFESSIHVPLVIRFPGQDRGARFAGLTQSVDIAPTVLSVAGVDRPRWMDGRTLVQDGTRGTEAILTLNFKDPVDQQVFETPTKVALRWHSYKLIHDCETGQALLYNLADDPGERINLAPMAPGLLTRLGTLLRSNLDGQIKGPKLRCLSTKEGGE